MIYTVLIIAVVILLFVLTLSQHRTEQSYKLFFVVLFYNLAFFSFFLFLCKDVFYLGHFVHYFPFPRSVIIRLYALNVSKTVLIRSINFFTLAFIFSNLLFAFSFTASVLKKYRKVILPSVGWYLVFQLFIYDPDFFRYIYIFLFPRFMTSVALYNLYDSIMQTTYVLNIGLLVLCMISLAYAIFAAPAIRLLKLNLVALFVSYTVLLSTYLFFLAWSPTLLVRYSRIAGITTYRSLVYSSSLAQYRYFPYVTFILLAFLVISLIRLSITRTRLANRTLQISRNIDVATTTTSLFCHYIKNELISLSAQIEELPVQPDNAKKIEQISDHLDWLFTRLNTMHQSIRRKTMNFRLIEIETVVDEALAEMEKIGVLDDIEVRVDKPSTTYLVFADPVFLQQALINLFHNACEAMHQTQRERKTLKIAFHANRRWISLEIEDNGTGIKKDDLLHIYTPFMTHKPLTKNWGIGLSLVHKVITEFGGRIDVESEYGTGTTFHLFLPAPRSIEE